MNRLEGHYHRTISNRVNEENMQEATIPNGLERRKEDYQLITGRARFVDDVRLPEERPAVLHMTVVRSPYAHAKITSIRPDAAMAMPGVVAILTGADLVNELRPLDIAMPLPGLKKPDHRPLAQGKVRYVGDPVAVVLAESLAIAVDARDMVDVDYAPLAAVVNPEAALDPGASCSMRTSVRILHSIHMQARVTSRLLLLTPITPSRCAWSTSVSHPARSNRVLACSTTTRRLAN